MPTSPAAEITNWNQANPEMSVYCTFAPETTAYRTYFDSRGMLGALQSNRLSATLRDEIAADPMGPAAAWQGLKIPNGDYTVLARQDSIVELLEYRVYLVQSGTLAGKRIVKFRGSDGIFRGFGFITREGGFSLWRRFASDENELYVRAARGMIQRIAFRNAGEVAAAGTALDEQVGANPYEIQIGDLFLSISLTHRCAFCNDNIREHNVITPIARCIQHAVRIPQRAVRAPAPTYVREADPELEALLDDEEAIDQGILQRTRTDRLRAARERAQAEADERSRRLAEVAAATPTPPLSQLGDGLIL